MAAARDRRGLDRMPRRPHLLHGHPIIRNFFADRCTHLAAMVAYYALLSLLPLLAIALARSALRPTRRGVDADPRAQQDLPRQVGREPRRASSAACSGTRPSSGSSAPSSLVWTSLGFLSALESALNIIYGVPNRPFVRQKLFVFALVGSGLALVLVAGRRDDGADVPRRARLRAAAAAGLADRLGSR